MRDRPALRQHRKAVPYTVTVIGGGTELAAWKKERERIDAEYEAAKSAAREEYKQRAIDAVKSQEGRKLTGDEAMEIAYQRGLQSPEAMSQFIRDFLLVPNGYPTSPVSVPKRPGVGARILGAVARIWRAAFP